GLVRLSVAGFVVRGGTQHVWPATFRPVTAVTVEAHRIQPDRARVPAATAEAIDRARAEGRRVVAVGTTTVRTLESAADERGGVRPFVGVAELTLRPGHPFAVVGPRLTHL